MAYFTFFFVFYNKPTSTTEYINRRFETEVFIRQCWSQIHICICYQHSASHGYSRCLSSRWLRCRWRWLIYGNNRSKFINEKTKTLVREKLLTLASAKVKKLFWISRKFVSQAAENYYLGTGEEACYLTKRRTFCF